MLCKKGFTFIEMMVTLVLIGIVILPTSYVYRNTMRTWLINKASLQIRRTAREAMDHINKDLTQRQLRLCNQAKLSYELK